MTALVRDLMQTEVTALRAEEDLQLADDIMRLGSVRHLPVLSGDRLVGIVSQRDLLRASISSLAGSAAAGQREWLGKIRVEEVMSRDLVTVGPETMVKEAVDRMVEKRVGCVPVVEGDRLVGLLSESDCMRYLSRVLEISNLRHHLPESPE